MHNHTPERVAFLEQVGFQRAILARELSLPQIHEIRAENQHRIRNLHPWGTLRQLQRSMLTWVLAVGGRSRIVISRGSAPNPCRRPCKLLGRQPRWCSTTIYVLWLHDLNLSASLDELVDAGVCSFKIEGRLKDKTYVMNVVAHYRKLLDAVLNERAMRPTAFRTMRIEIEPDPNKTFNRGYLIIPVGWS